MDPPDRDGRLLLSSYLVPYMTTQRVEECAVYQLRAFGVSQELKRDGKLAY